jgi:hypothetical protein
LAPWQTVVVDGFSERKTDGVTVGVTVVMILLLATDEEFGQAAELTILHITGFPLASVVVVYVPLFIAINDPFWYQ